MIKTMVLFILAGLRRSVEVTSSGCGFGKDMPTGTAYLGGIILVFYGVIPTLQSFPSFGRVYAAYGGVFVILSVLWGPRL